MADKTVRGRFVWHELTTPDSAAAHAFYSKVVGWTTQPWEQDPSYSMFAASSGPLGGSVQSMESAPHWLPYIGTPDIDATIQQVTRLGGSVKKEATAMPTGSKYAVLADPQGATFGVYWSSTDPGKESAPKRGEHSWHELATTDQNAAAGFYSSVFGWDKMQEHDMGPSGSYLILGRNGTQQVGMWRKPAEMPGGPAWLSYVRVKDVNQTAKKVKSAGGQVVNGPMEVPGGDWIVQYVDSHGAMSAVHALAADMKPAAAPAAAPAAKAEAPAAKPAAAAKPAPAKPAAAAKKAPAKKAAAPKKKAAKKAAAKKPAARKKAAGKKKSAKKQGSAARGAKRPARKAAKKVGKKKRSGGKKKSAKKPRKGK